MTQQTQSLRGRKYSGDLYARKYGSSDVFEKMGNVTEFTTKSETEKDELKSTGRDDFGQAIEVEVVPQPTEISLKFNTFDKHALARVLMGEAVDIGGVPEVINETAVKASKTGWIKLNHNDIDPENFKLKNKSKQDIEKAKYELNPRLGMVRLLDSTGINDGDNLHYEGKTKGRKGFAIDANTLQSIPLELYLDGKDRISGNDGVLEVAHVVLSADGDINWFEDGWWESGLTGTIVKDEGKPAMRFTEFVD
ncbi:Uncharacterised protein [Moraxella caprae]|uniref:Major tail protein n=1 Tax=Moraxella caprae TaxID=90240 RepID=A0A378QXE5_9GAMM|nr:hypothetical protein [Moraxella caprae]STZ07219.1 Uncharacterised protein [Moraxella caprae]